MGPIEEKVREIVRVQIAFHSSRPYLAGYLISEMHGDPERIARIMAKRGHPPRDVLRRQIRDPHRPVGASLDRGRPEPCGPLAPSSSS